MAFVARSQRRSRGVALIVLALFVGIAGALSVSFIAGARRSSSVVDRLASLFAAHRLRLTRVADVLREE